MFIFLVFSTLETSFLAIQETQNNEDNLASVYNNFEKKIMKSTGNGLLYGNYPVLLSAIKTAESEYTLDISFKGELLSYDNVLLEITSYRENKIILSKTISSSSKIQIENLKRFYQYNIAIICSDNEFDTVYLGDFYFIDNQEELMSEIECDLVMSKVNVAKNNDLAQLTKEYKNLISLGHKPTYDIKTGMTGTQRINLKLNKTSNHSYSKTNFSQKSDIKKFLLKETSGGFVNN